MSAMPENPFPRPSRQENKPAAKPEAGNKAKVIAFFSFLGVFCLLGFMWFLRPSESALEKRTLTPFPEFTWESFASGEYFSQISLWYSDTYPFRETFLAANNHLKEMWGIRNEQVVGGPGVGEEIPDVTTGGSDQIVITDTAVTGSATATTAPTPDTTTTTPPTTTTPAPGDEPEPERSGSLYIVGNSAYDLYYFTAAASDRYASLIARAGEKLNGTAKVYDMIIPLSYSIGLSKTGQNKIGTSDGEAAINYMYAKIREQAGNRVTPVSIYPTLSAHKDEYLYFRTDHHWTALGAYYAYCVFSAVKGIPATPLSSYAVTSYEGFLGTHYAATGSSKLLPDTLTAYIPSATNAIYITDRSGSRLKYSQGIVTPDISRIYSAVGSQYNCFIAGDNPLSEIYNESKTNASSILVVKESFGNAFVPFLVDSYQTVYVIDYRYYKGDLTEFVRSHNVGDVLFINNLSATGASARLGELERLIGD